jgi:hypothetical protein
MRLLAAVPRVQIHRILRPGLFWLHLVTIRGAAAAGERGRRRATPTGLKARGARGGAGWARSTARGPGKRLQRRGASTAQQAAPARTLDEDRGGRAWLRRRWLSEHGGGGGGAGWARREVRPKPKGFTWASLVNKLNLRQWFTINQ